MSSNTLLKKNDSDFNTLKKKLYELMDFLGQMEKIRSKLIIN